MPKGKIKFILLTFTLIVLGSLFLFSNPEPAQAGYEHNVYQWVWSSENIGWFSLNSVNVSDPEEITYGLDVDYRPDVRSVSGLAWSEHTGWICFGETCETFDWEGAFRDMGYDDTLVDSWCSDPPGSQTKPDIQYAQTDETVREIEKGWGRIVNLAVYGKAVEEEDNWGWISLTGRNTGASNHYWTHINMTTRTLGGWAWSGTSGDPNQGRGGYGWIAFAYRPETIDTGTISGRVTDAETGEGVGGIKIYTDIYFHETETKSAPPVEIGEYKLEDVEYGTYTITAFDPPSSPRTQKYNFDTKSATLDETHDPLIVDFELYKGIPEECTEEISGTVCYDQNENNICELGEELSGASVLIAGAGFFQSPPLTDGKYKCSNACPGRDYKIFAWYIGTLPEEGLEVFRLTSTVTSKWDPNLGVFPITDLPLHKRPAGPRVTGPWIQTWWSDVHAKDQIDVSATPAPHYANATYLVTAGEEIYQFTSYHKWRKPGYNLELPTDLQALSDEIIDRLEGEAEPVASGEISADDFIDLDPETPEVWKCDGNLDITGGKFGPGAKTIIVDGDLTFSGDVKYDTSQPYSSAELPSVGFIVKGNMEVKETVGHIVGNFYITGQQLTISSTYDKTTEKQFVCEGLMIAKLFSFDRVIADADPNTKGPWSPKLSDGVTEIYPYKLKEAPSEIIYYDSRVVVNTPKGFEDFSKALPTWEER